MNNELDTMNIALWCTWHFPIREPANYIYKGDTICNEHFRRVFTEDAEIHENEQIIKGIRFSDLKLSGELFKAMGGTDGYVDGLCIKEEGGGWVSVRFLFKEKTNEN